MIESITLGQLTAGLAIIASLFTSITAIVAFVSKPIKDMKGQLNDIKETVNRLDNSFNELKGKQIKMGKDIHMSMIISKYLLDCETDASDKGKKIRDEFNDYIINAATDQGDDADA